MPRFGIEEAISNPRSLSSTLHKKYFQWLTHFFLFGLKPPRKGRLATKGSGEKKRMTMQSTTVSMERTHIRDEDEDTPTSKRINMHSPCRPRQGMVVTTQWLSTHHTPHGRSGVVWDLPAPVVCSTSLHVGDTDVEIVVCGGRMYMILPNGLYEPVAVQMGPRARATVLEAPWIHCAAQLADPSSAHGVTFVVYGTDQTLGRLEVVVVAAPSAGPFDDDGDDCDNEPVVPIPPSHLLPTTVRLSPVPREARAERESDDDEPGVQPTRHFTGVKSIVGGRMSLVALTDRNRVYTWTSPDAPPRRVHIDARVARVVAGDAVYAAVSETGAVYTWGRTRLVGRLGRTVRTDSDALLPGLVLGWRDSCGAVLKRAPCIRTVAFGACGALALSITGELYGWGDALGVCVPDTSTPARVPQLVHASFKSAVATTGAYLALDSRNRVYFWNARKMLHYSELDPHPLKVIDTIHLCQRSDDIADDQRCTAGAAILVGR